MNDYVHVHWVDRPKDAATVQLLGEIREELTQVVYEVEGMRAAPQPEFSLPLHEVKMELNGHIKVAGTQQHRPHATQEDECTCRTPMID